MVNGTLLNFDKRSGNNLINIFDQWLKLHLGLDALNNQKNLNGIYRVDHTYIDIFKAYLTKPNLTTYLSNFLQNWGFSSKQKTFSLHITFLRSFNAL